MKVTKAVIPAAGLGTRFLPATKAQPKEMLPIVDKPTIQYIVEEAVDAGITDILIITGKNKRAIEDHFDRSFQLEHALAEKEKSEMLELVRGISNLANVHYIRQKEAKGLGHAVLCARTFMGNEPFAVMLGDDVVVSEVPCIQQLMDIYEEKTACILGVQAVKQADIHKFGIVDVKEKMENHRGRLVKVNSLVEKPQPQEAPSDIAILGRYILTPDVFLALEQTGIGAGGEIQLTDALKTLAQTQDMYAYNFAGRRYDVGDKQGFLEATVEIALSREDLKGPFGEYLKQIAQTL